MEREVRRRGVTKGRKLEEGRGWREGEVKLRTAGGGGVEVPEG